MSNAQKKKSTKSQTSNRNPIRMKFCFNNLFLKDLFLKISLSDIKFTFIC